MEVAIWRNRPPFNFLYGATVPPANFLYGGTFLHIDIDGMWLIAFELFWGSERMMNLRPSRERNYYIQHTCDRIAMETPLPKLEPYAVWRNVGKYLHGFVIWILIPSFHGNDLLNNGITVVKSWYGK